MQYDGGVYIEVVLDENGMFKGFKRLQDGMDDVDISVRKVGKSINNVFSKMDVSKPVANAAANLKRLEEQLDAVTAERNIAVSDGDDKSAERLEKKRIAIYDRIEAAREKLSIEIQAAAAKEAAAEEKEAERSARAAEKEAAAKQRAQEKQFRAATKGARHFGVRLREIVTGALFFNIVSAGLRNITQYFGAALLKNNEFAASFAQLQGAFYTAFQPIYEFVLPALTYLMRVLTAVMQVIGRFFAFLTGKSYSQMQKNAKALNNQASAISGVGDAAEEAEKQLLGFDEINKLSSMDSTASGGGVEGISGIQPDFSGEFDTEEYKNKIEELTVYLSGALLALGAILTFSGANIPLGIGLMAAGALGLASVIVPNWNAMSDELKGAIALVSMLLGGAALAIGAVLAFSGANVPLGITLMSIGATSIASAVALNWDGIGNAMKGPVGKIVTFLSASMLALGAILLLSGANIPLGIGLLMAGAVGLAAAISPNWGWLLEKLQGIGQDIKEWANGILDYFSTTFSDGFIHGVATMIEDAIYWLWDVFVDFINNVIENWNNIWGSFTRTNAQYQMTGTISPQSQALYQTRSIPQLAQGAVIPPNRKFLAVLGDQTHGNNIEAPEDLIRKIVREEAGGDPEVANLLRELIEVVLGIEIGDEVIGRAAARYNRKASRAGGY